jgi:hypothetical protein
VREFIAYMRFRATAERTEWAMPDDFIQQHYDLGVRTFFGVTLDDDGMESDRENPETFRAWQRRKLH